MSKAQYSRIKKERYGDGIECSEN